MLHTGIVTETENVPKAYLPQNLSHSPAMTAVEFQRGLG